MYWGIIHVHAYTQFAYVQYMYIDKKNHIWKYKLLGKLLILDMLCIMHSYTAYFKL